MIDLSRRRFLSAALAGSAGLALPAAARPGPLPATARMVTPEEPDYETWRRAMVWQARKPDRRPAAIVRVSHADEVPDVLAYAKRQGLKVAVKSGGHHLWGAAVREAALTLDLGLLADVKVDARNGKVAVGPALWSRELALALSREGLAFPVAHCATVPMGGYLLGGGFGVNGDTWGGMACFWIEGADVVDANGRARRVSRTEDPDLFWALRGAGNGFPGVVTRFFLRTDPLPGAITESVHVFPLNRAGEVAALVARLASDGLPNTELMMLLAADPGAAAGPEPPERICVLRPVCFAASMKEAHDSLAPLSEHPLMQEALFSIPHREVSMDQLQLGSIDYATQFGYGRYLVDSDWSAAPEAAVRALAQTFSSAPARNSHCVILFKNPPRLPEDAACSLMAPVWMGRYAAWQDESLDGRVLDWLAESSRVLAVHSLGHYINEVDVRGGRPRIQACFSPRAWRRLSDLRAERDPNGRFAGFLST